MIIKTVFFLGAILLLLFNLLIWAALAQMVTKDKNAKRDPWFRVYLSIAFFILVTAVLFVGNWACMVFIN